MENKPGGKEWDQQVWGEAGEAVKSQSMHNLRILIKNITLWSKTNGKPVKKKSNTNYKKDWEVHQIQRSRKFTSQLRQCLKRSHSGHFRFRGNLEMSYISPIFLWDRLGTVFYSKERQQDLCSLRRENTSYLWNGVLRIRVKYNLIGFCRDFYIYFFKTNQFITYKYGIEINYKDTIFCTKRGFKSTKSGFYFKPILIVIIF